MTDVSRLAPATATARAKAAGRWPGAFGPRFFVALLLGLVWIGPAWWDHRFINGMAAWDAVVLLAWFRDLGRLPRPEEVQISRQWLEPLAQGDETAVALEVRNELQVTLHISLQDDLPAALG